MRTPVSRVSSVLRRHPLFQIIHHDDCHLHATHPPTHVHLPFFCHRPQGGARRQGRGGSGSGSGHGGAVRVERAPNAGRNFTTGPKGTKMQITNLHYDLNEKQLEVRCVFSYWCFFFIFFFFLFIYLFFFFLNLAGNLQQGRYLEEGCHSLRQSRSLPRDC